MVVVVRKYERNVVEQSVNPTPVKAAQSSLGQLGEGVSDVGDMLLDWQDEVDTADAKSADAAYSDLIRQELYGDDNGFMYSQGSDSMSRRLSVSERIDAEQKRILEELSPGARKHAQSAMEARRQRALLSIDEHVNGQRRTYLNAAADARISSTINDAIYNPDLVGQSLRTNRQEILDKAAREGWPKEVTQQELEKSSTAIHSGVIERLAIADPIQALGYLREKRGEMSGAEVARLEAHLVPIAREREGSAIADRVFGGDWIRYKNQGAIRNDPLNNRLISALSFLPDMGIEMEVFSGGQENNTSHGTGSTRHNHGNAADVFFYKDGRQLSWSNASDVPIFQEIVRRARAAGVTGFGAGPGYMRDGSMHIGFGTAAVWGAGGSGDNAPAWLRDAFSDETELAALPSLDRSGGLSAIIAATDGRHPDVQEAAIRRYELRSAVQAKETETRRQAAQDAALQLIEAGGDIEDLPLSHRQEIGLSGLTSLRNLQATKARGMPVITDSVFYVELSDMAANSPEKFMSLDPTTWTDRLDEEDFQYFVKIRSDMMAGGDGSSKKPPTVSALRTAASQALRSAGFDTKDDPEEVAAFETSLLRWSSRVTRETGKAPDPVEINQRINEMLVPVVIDPKGLGNKQTGSAFEMDYDGKAHNPNDDVTPEMLRDGALTINGISVSNQIMEIFANGFFDEFGVAPTVQELVEGLISTGVYND